MPNAAESTNYDLFDYRHFDENPLSLDEAMKESSRLRLLKPDQFHRIIPVDPAMSGFRVDSLPKEAIYMQFRNRWMELWMRLVSRDKTR